MLHIVFALSCVIWFIIFVIVHVQFPFWNIQPIYHQYDYWRFMYTTPFIVHKQRPCKTKYLDTSHVFTFPIEDISEIQKYNYLRLLQGYALPDNQNVLYTFTNDDFRMLFSDHLYPCYVSFYYQDTPIPTDKTLTFCNTHYLIEPYAAVYSIPVVMNILPVSWCKEYIRLDIPFHSHPIVKDEGNKNVIRKIFQTHCSEYINKHPDQKVALFCKYGEPHSGIIPIVEWKSYTYYVMKYPPIQELDNCYMSNVNKDTIHLLDKIYTNETTIDNSVHTPFSLCIMVSISNLIFNITTQNKIVYIMKCKDTIQGIYFFTKRPIEYEEPTGKTLELSGSISYQPDNVLFFKGFLQGLHDVMKTNKEYKYLHIHENSHNTLLIPHWHRQYRAIQVDPVAYYTYNYIIPQSPFYSGSVFILL